METIDKEFTSDSGLVITSQSAINLKEIGRWTNFLAIVGFVSLGLLVIAALFMFGVGYDQFIIMGLTYIAMAVLYFFPTYYLFNFSKKIKAGFNSSIQSEVDDAFENLKKMFKFVGVLTIIVIGIYALLFVFGILAGGMF